MATYRNDVLVSVQTLGDQPGRTCRKEESITPGSRVGLTFSPPASAGRFTGPVGPCPFRGEPTGEVHDCRTCGGKKQIPVVGCSHYGRCTVDHQLILAGERLPWCRTCPVLRQPAVPLRRRVRMGPNLVAGEAAAQLNASLYRWQGRLLMAYRTGWAGARIHIAELNEDYTVRSNTTLTLRHQRCNYGQEDPRLFEHAGRLWCAFIGVRGHQHIVDTHQLVCRLGDDLTAEEVIYPDYPLRQAWEKNWQFFEHGRALYAIYSMHPWQVVRITPGAAMPAARHDWAPAWAGGSLRGGASPVRVGNEFWCFFHGKTEPHYMYSLGVCTFDATPPFQPRRITPIPLLWADRATKPKDQYAPVVFPCGAVLDGDTWRVSCGIHDRWVEILEFSHQGIEQAMVSV